MTVSHLLIGVLCIAFALLIHEFAHAWMSYQLGDPTAKYEGRLTLNPLVHFEPVGFICLVATFYLSHGSLVMGWAKPVPINSDNFKNYSLDTCLVAAAGPFVNLFASFFCSLFILTGLVANTIVSPVFYYLVLANVCFALFNLIPWPPLDGWKILGAMGGSGLARKMERLEHRLGIYSLLILLFIVYFLGPYTLYPAIDLMVGIFTGA